MATPWDQMQSFWPAAGTPEDLWGQIGRLAWRGGTGTRWVFRGVPNDQFRVQSSLVRRLDKIDGRLPDEDRLRAVESQLIEQARLWGVGNEAAGEADDMHVLALMQHHGLPTRLLDVSASPLTALWFACQRQRDKDGDFVSDVDGVVIAFNVTDHPVYRTSGRMLGTNGLYTFPPHGNWEQAVEESAKGSRWFLVQPTVRDARMTAQDGLFLTSAITPGHIGSTVPMDCMPRPHNVGASLLTMLAEISGGELEGQVMPGPAVIVFRVGASLKEPTRRVLAGTFNTSAHTLFPDLAGMRDALGANAVLFEQEN